VRRRDTLAQEEIDLILLDSALHQLVARFLARPAP
jgi:hypothetical protein